MAVLPGWLDLLPRLEVVVLVGRQAQRTSPSLTGRSLRVFQSAHPSPQVRAANPASWAAIPEVWAEARAALRG